MLCLCAPLDTNTVGGRNYSSFELQFEEFHIQWYFNKLCKTLLEERDTLRMLNESFTSICTRTVFPPRFHLVNAPENAFRTLSEFRTQVLTLRIYTIVHAFTHILHHNMHHSH